MTNNDIQHEEDSKNLPRRDRLFWFMADATIWNSLVRSGTLVGFLVTIFAAPLAANQIENYPPYFFWLAILGVLIAVGSIGVSLDIRRIGLDLRDNKFANIDRMRGQIEQLTIDNQRYREKDEIAAMMGREKFDRAEEIFEDNGKRALIGFIPFNPTVICEHHTGRFNGIGPELISRIFGTSVRIKPEKCTWDEAFDMLARGDIDIIGTPMYDVPERRKYAQFTAPIFYADMGLYCANPRNLTDSEARGIVDIPKALFDDNQFEPMNFKDAIEKLSDEKVRHEVRKSGKYKISAVEGELNSKLSSRRLSSIVTLNIIHNQPFEVISAISGLLDRENIFHSDIVFCERAQAEKTEMFEDGKILNLLKDGQLLFPVCFAIRKNEDTLRKFADMRLLEIENSADGGLSSLIAQKAFETNQIGPDDARKFFRRNGFPGHDLNPFTQDPGPSALQS